MSRLLHFSAHAAQALRLARRRHTIDKFQHHIKYFFHNKFFHWIDIYDLSAFCCLDMGKLIPGQDNVFHFYGNESYLRQSCHPMKCWHVFLIKIVSLTQEDTEFDINLCLQQTTCFILFILFVFTSLHSFFMSQDVIIIILLIFFGKQKKVKFLWQFQFMRRLKILQVFPGFHKMKNKRMWMLSFFSIKRVNKESDYKYLNLRWPTSKWIVYKLFVMQSGAKIYKMLTWNLFYGVLKQFYIFAQNVSISMKNLKVS